MLLIVWALLCVSSVLYAQNYDIILKGGHLIDPKNKINEKMDVAISQGKIIRVASNIPPTYAKKVIDVSGLYVRTRTWRGIKSNWRNKYACV